MKRFPVLLVMMAFLSGTVSIAGAQSEEQSAKAKKIAKAAKVTSSKELMMPAPEAQLKRLTQGLKLTTEQQNKIRPLLEDEYAQLKQIRENEDLSPKQIQMKVEALRTETIAKMQTHMTPEQKETHEMISKEIKANKQKRIKDNRKARIGTKSDPPKQVIK